MIQADPNGLVADRLRAILADAVREQCRRTLEQEIADFDFRTDPNNCDVYTPESMVLSAATVEASEFDDSPGSPVELNPACFGACLLDDCGTQGTSGGRGWTPSTAVRATTPSCCSTPAS